MRFFALILFAALAACQSCKNTPSPAPPILIIQDSGAGDASLDVSTLPPADAGLEASVSAQDSSVSDPCFGSVIGPAHAFCSTQGAFFSSVVPATVQARSKLATLQPSSTASNRLVVRHSNGLIVKMKTVVVLTNTGSASGSLIVFKKGVAGPTQDLPVGEDLAAGRWVSSTAKPVVPVPPGKSVRFDASVEVGLQQGYATMGFYEYTFGQPHTMTICFLGEREDWSVCAGL
jgi:hypothetical protein